MALNLSSTLQPEMAADPGRALALSSRFIRFGPFQVDQHRQEVSRNGLRLKLQGKVYQVLLALIEKQGEVVTREQLRVRLWPADTHVNYDANVNTTVNKLRQALGDSSENPVYVETIPRKGYCLMVPAEFADAPLPVVTRAGVAGSNSKSHQKESAPDAPKSDIWVTLGVIGLILAGMLLGAGITKLWLLHFAQTPGGLWP
jgi:DNA-binding winged helix-turn-helix (wHTH) protein